jgi:RNA polymerase sigma-70 factor (ECF subfamily)
MSHDADLALARSIAGGDRAALGKLVAREHSWLVRLARAIVREPAIAEEVVQDGWVQVIRSLSSYEGRSSLRTWMATIVLNRAKTVAVRGGRTIAVASLGDGDHDDESAETVGCVDRARYGSVGFWSKPPEAWADGTTPEAIVSRRQALEAINASLEALPANQRAVLTLRDLEGWSSEEVCNALGLSESNQRVLLHRARAKVRESLEGLLGAESRS